MIGGMIGAVPGVVPPARASITRAPCAAGIAARATGIAARATACPGFAQGEQGRGRVGHGRGKSEPGENLPAAQFGRLAGAVGACRHHFILQS